MEFIWVIMDHTIISIYLLTSQACFSYLCTLEVGEDGARNPYFKMTRETAPQPKPRLSNTALKFKKKMKKKKSLQENISRYELVKSKKELKLNDTKL